MLVQYTVYIFHLLDSPLYHFFYLSITFYSLLCSYSLSYVLETAAKDRLSDLNSREGDWFMDELCTMSGNVSQMAETLDFCLNVSGNNEVLFICSIYTVHVLYIYVCIYHFPFFLISP